MGRSLLCGGRGNAEDYDAQHDQHARDAAGRLMNFHNCRLNDSCTKLVRSVLDSTGGEDTVVAGLVLENAHVVEFRVMPGKGYCFGGLIELDFEENSSAGDETLGGALEDAAVDGQTVQPAVQRLARLKVAD